MLTTSKTPGSCKCCHYSEASTATVTEHCSSKECLKGQLPQRKLEMPWNPQQGQKPESTSSKFDHPKCSDGITHNFFKVLIFFLKKERISLNVPGQVLANSTALGLYSVLFIISISLLRFFIWWHAIPVLSFSSLDMISFYCLNTFIIAALKSYLRSRTSGPPER